MVVNNAPRFEFIVDDHLSGVRIDTFLERHLRNYTSWRLQRIVRAGLATIDAAPADQVTRVRAGQTVSIALAEPPDKQTYPAAVPLSFLYEDPWMVAVNKPAGMIAHPAGDHQVGSLVDAMQCYLDQKTSYPGLLRPGIVHRLDRQTSGVMVVATEHFGHRTLGESFERGRVAKSYLALVVGEITPNSGVIEYPIGRTRTGRQVLMSCGGDSLDPRPACTRYTVLQRFRGFTLVLAQPTTGRNHQIRVHFATIGFPLVGDEFYESGGRIKPLRTKVVSGDDETDPSDVETGLPLRRHALHAIRLELAHPVTQEWLAFQAPLPEDFSATLRELSPL